MEILDGEQEAVLGEVRFSRFDGGVGVLTLDRPKKLNALTASMTEALASYISRINADKGLRAIVLTGAGRSFCVGSDIDELDHYDSPWEFSKRLDYGDLLRKIRVPIIAAINGYAFGGGLEMALACDIRLCASTASFAASEIKLGWIGGSGQSALLAKSIGLSNAALMLLTGEPVDATKALSWGLVSSVLEPDLLFSNALELAGKIAAQAPIAAQVAKLDLQAALAMPLDQAIAWERHLQTVCFATEDANEGRAAFRSHRTPIFEGR